MALRPKSTQGLDELLFGEIIEKEVNQGDARVPAVGVGLVQLAQHLPHSPLLSDRRVTLPVDVAG